MPSPSMNRKQATSRLLPTAAVAPIADTSNNIKMFSDIHRYITQRHADIEWLKNLHIRKDKQNQEAIAECNRSLEHDSAERVSHITRLSEEMQRHTVRKVDALQKELTEHQVAAKRGDAAMQCQIDRMVRELDSMHSGLNVVADAVDKMVTNCVPPELRNPAKPPPTMK